MLSKWRSNGEPTTETIKHCCALMKLQQRLQEQMTRAYLRSGKPVISVSRVMSARLPRIPSVFIVAHGRGVLCLLSPNLSPKHKKRSHSCEKYLYKSLISLVAGAGLEPATSGL